MNKREFIKAAYTIDDSDHANYFSDDFQWTDELGSPPMNKTTWLGMDRLMRSAFSDLSLVVEEIQADGDDFIVTSRFRGTFSNDMDLSPLGMGVIPATGKAVDFPSQRDRVFIGNGKISRMHNLETGPDAGLSGFLKAIGVDIG